MKLDPRLFHFLRAISEHGSFSRAAIAENISQPALSNKIAMLEQQIGVRVLDRGRHGARLNEYGRSLIHHAKAIDVVLEQAVQEIELRKQGFAGPLTIGGSPVTVVELIPRALTLMQAADTKFAVKVIEADDDELVEKLKSGEIELLLSGGAPGLQFDNIVHRPLVELPVTLVLATSHKLANRRNISIKALMDQQWVLPPQDSVFRHQIEAMFFDAGLPLPPRLWVGSSLLALKSIVARTQAVTVLPKHVFALEQKAGLLKSVQLSDANLSRHVGVIWLRTRALAPLAERFLAAVTEIAPSIK